MKKKIHESPKDQQQHISIIVDERKNFHNGELTSGKTLEVFLLQSPITRELLLYFSQLTISLIEKRFIMTPLKSRLIFLLFVPFKIPQLPQKSSTHSPDFSPRKSPSAATRFSLSSHHSFLHFFPPIPLSFQLSTPLLQTCSYPSDYSHIFFFQALKTLTTHPTLLQSPCSVFHFFQAVTSSSPALHLQASVFLPKKLVLS